MRTVLAEDRRWSLPTRRPALGCGSSVGYPVGVMQFYFQNVLTGLFGMNRDDAIASLSASLLAA
jgi:hypothetical protein